MLDQNEFATKTHQVNKPKWSVCESKKKKDEIESQQKYFQTRSQTKINYANYKSCNLFRDNDDDSFVNLWTTDILCII